MTVSAKACDESVAMGHDWAEQELGGANFGDARLSKRLVKTAAAFFADPEGSVPSACGAWSDTKAVYRFFDNSKVQPKEITASHRERVLDRAREHPVVLAVADTTILDFTRHPETAGLGPLSSVVCSGFFYHPSLCVTPERVPLGVIHEETWVRDIDQHGGSDRETMRELPVEEKESRKWLASVGASEAFQRQVGPSTTVVSVFDREGDVFEVLSTCTAPDTQHELLIRAVHNRRLETEEQKMLWSSVEELEPAGQRIITVPRKPKQKPRAAQLTVRFTQALLRVPRKRGQRDCGKTPVQIYAVQVREEDPPEGAEAIKWNLLTTIPVESLEDACRMVEYYSCRWMIELFFKVLKSGCKFEKRQLETVDRLRTCLAVDAIVAWRITYLTMIGRDTPDLPCTAVFEDYEWKSIWCFVHQTPELPEATPTLREVVRMIGRMGGHLGRKSDGEPGFKSMWRGLQGLPYTAAMWLIFQPDAATSRKT